MSEESCLFCRLVRKELPVSVVYEDRRVMAFMDVKPLNEGHTLVIPKRHYKTIYDVPEEEVSCLFRVVKRVACAVKKAMKPDGVSITQHNEKGAGQDVFHLHVHVIPRYEGQKLPRYKEARLLPEASRTKLEEVARRLREHLVNH